ncbi:MAG TPA: NAD(P)-dependent oxidoreductase [Cytophagales bacterium]|nr:NAD(P)-dependent oxidoreductase [Cytophagales bacterium]
MSNKKVLVAGATGYLGHYLVRELKKRGYWVRVLVRQESQREQFEMVDEVFVGQITQPETLKGVTQGIDWVFSTVGITRQKDGLTYMDVDYQGNANLLQQALTDGVAAFQYVSAIGGDQLRHLKIFEAKERFVDELKAASIQHSIVRPNGFFSDMGDFLDMAKRGRVYLFGDGQFRLNPIHGADLAEYCVEAMEAGAREVTVGGPDTLSHNELAALALLAWQKPVRITHLPDWTRRLAIWGARTFTSPKTYGPLEFFLTAMGGHNVAPATGSRHLQDYFKSEAYRR